MLLWYATVHHYLIGSTEKKCIITDTYETPPIIIMSTLLHFCVEKTMKVIGAKRYNTLMKNGYRTWRLHCKKRGGNNENSTLTTYITT